MITADAKPCFKELTWIDVQQEVQKVSPTFAAIVNGINPGKELPFIKIRYPFGSRIVSNGCLNVVTEHGNILPINSPHLPNALKKHLNYSLVPLGLVTNHSIEVYRELEDRVFSIAAWGKGLDIGIWEHFGWTTPYSVTAGARSLYMIPRVTLTSAHKRLKRKFGITLPPPKRACDHWRVFRQIANSPELKNKWYLDVIYLSSEWINKLNQYKDKENQHWSRLHNYLITKNLEHSVYGRRRSIFEIVWEIFSRSLNTSSMKHNPYVIDTLKHLVFIGTGGSPGSAPYTGCNDLGPIGDIQKAYLHCYGLKDYVPTIMQPHYLTLENPRPIYYSLQSPTLLESVPKSRNLTSIVDNLRELVDIVQHFLKEAFDDHLKIANISINEIINRLQFEFFHEETYAYGNIIKPNSTMPNNDSNLLYLPEKLNSRKFADTSAYLHGCVRISLKNNEQRA